MPALDGAAFRHLVWLDQVCGRHWLPPAATLRGMSDSTGYFLATFPGVGRALFSEVETAQEWCDRRAAQKYPGDVVEWAEPEDVGVGAGQEGQQWLRQVPKSGHNIPPIDLGSVVSLPLDAEA